MLGCPCTTQMLIDEAKPFTDKIDVLITELQREHKVVVGAIDDNQKGHSLTCQRFRSSNEFPKAVTRFLREVICFAEIIEEVSQTSIVHVNQNIPSPFNTPPSRNFDNVAFDVVKDPSAHSCAPSFPLKPIEIEGLRVSGHMKRMPCYNVLSSMLKHMTGQNSVKKKLNIVLTCQRASTLNK